LPITGRLGGDRNWHRENPAVVANSGGRLEGKS
jgi:hypothetical protein